ncbi:MAG: glycosyltransferase family 4 protein [Candidatus Altiarchaeota archaeon]
MQRTRETGDRVLLQPVFPGMQKDFTILPEGRSFVEVMGHKQEFLQGLTVLRVCDRYGITNDHEGSLVAGGLEIHISQLDRSLARYYPIHIHVACLADKGDETVVPLKDGGWKGDITIHPIRHIGSNPFLHSRRILKLAEEVEADIVHLHNPNNPMNVSVARQLSKRGTGLAITFHSQHKPKNQDGADGGVVRGGDFGRLRRIFQEHWADGGVPGIFSFGLDVAVRFLSRFYKTKRETIYEIAGERGQTGFISYGLVGVGEASLGEFGGRDSIVIGRPMDSEFFDPEKVSGETKAGLRKRYGLGDGTKVVVVHARITPVKGQDLLPAVAQAMRDRMGGDFKFILKGTFQDDNFISGLRADVEKRGLRNNFIIEEAGNQEEIRDLLSIADLDLMASRGEGLGGQGIEALLMRVPVVAHRVGGIPSFVKDGETGYLVEFGDTEAMAEKAVETLTDPKKARRMGERGRELCVSLFSAKKVCENYLSLVYGPQALRKWEASGK